MSRHAHPPHAYGYGSGPGTHGHSYHRPPPTFQYHPPQHYHVPPEDPVQRKRRKCLYMFYGLRQASLIVPLVLILLNINIYVSRRGRYLNGSTSPADAVYFSMWLTAPLSGVIFIWAVIAMIQMCGSRAPDRPSISYPVQFGVELLFALGTLVCFILMVVNIADKQNSGYYEYPYFRYEVPLACLLGFLMIIQVGLVARAYFEVSNRTQRDGLNPSHNQAMAQV
ncbi:hypothetical protein ACHAQH_007910 [Verticillium albo-atrum]